MNHPAEFKYYWSDKHDKPAPRGWELISELDFRENEGRSESIAETGDLMPAWAHDLLRVSRAAYVADKKSLREVADDRWTRRIHLSVPMLEPDPWDGARSHLHGLLETLTGDRWDVTFRSGASAGLRQGQIDNWQAAAVALLSGGLDSTAFAAGNAREAGGSVLFVMFYDPKMKRPQAELFRSISSLGQRCLYSGHISQTVLGHGRPLELTSRSRGLLYIATAVYAAAAYDVREVLVPENGQLAVNLPLSPSRAGACSTRSVHPRTLNSLNRLIAAIGGNVTVENPFHDYTKGEVCLYALNAGFRPELLFRTVSCSHPPIKRHGQAPYHCGYCYPCLVRRAGLWHALHEDRTLYKWDPWNLPYKDPKAEDLQALQLWLCRDLSVKDIIGDVALPPDIAPASLMPVLHRARNELSAILDAMLPMNGPYRRNWHPMP
jgi:hypothetical protein